MTDFSMPNPNAAKFLAFMNRLNNTSVFNEDTFNKTIDAKYGAYKIVIESEGSKTISSQDESVKIIGVLTDKVIMNSSAEWGSLELDSAIGNLVSNVPLVNDLADASKFAMKIGGYNLESGLQSKKFYTGGSYMNLGLNFRILDDDNSGKAIATAMSLFLLTMPREDKNLTFGQALNEIINPLGKKVMDAAKAKFEKDFSSSKEEIYDAAKKVTKYVIDNGPKFDDAFSQQTLKVLNDAWTNVKNEDMRLTESPSSVRISIGHWLKLENMVVDSVEVNYSEQMTEIGPLYIDVNMNVSSRNRLIMSSDGIKNGSGRIKIVKNNRIEENNKNGVKGSLNGANDAKSFGNIG